MVTSEPRLRSVLFAMSISTLAILSACGTLTGLSDDYQYVLDGGGTAGTDGSTNDGASGASSGNPGDPSDAAAEGGRECTTTERARATTQMTAVSGDLLPNACRQCLASNCCDEIDSCAKSGECANSMRCVFQCQKENGSGNQKVNCVNDCRPSFLDLVGACLRDRCAAPTCQLR